MPEESGQQAPPQPPLNPDLAGYPSVEHLVGGYRASSEEAKRWRERAEAAERRVQEQTYVQPQRQDVPQRGPMDPGQRLREEGWPIETLEQWIDQRADQKFAQRLQPLVDGVQARNQLLGAHPDYQKFEADVFQYISQDPDAQQRYNRMLAADPAGAMEYAFLKFGDNRRRQHPSNNGSAVVNQQMTETQIPSNRAGEARMQGYSEDAVQRAWERYQQTGSRKDAEAYARERLHRVVTDEHLEGR